MSAPLLQSLRVRRRSVCGSRRGKSGDGFTLIEIMIALALTSVLVLGLVELFVSTTRNARGADSLMELQENGRTALQLITSDVRRLGYFASLVDTALVAGTSGGEPGAATCVAGDDTWGRMIDQPIFGIDDPPNITAAYACITAAEYEDDDVLVVRYTPSVPVLVADMIATRPYLRTGLRSNRGALFLGAATGNTDNDVLDATAETFPLVAHAYFIGDSGRSCEGIDTPSLFRKAIGDTGAPVSQELVPGVERMQLRYLAGNQYFDADDPALNWDDVFAVEVQLLVRTTCPEVGFVNDKSFTMGGTLSPAYTPSDGFRRQVFTAVTSIRNRG